MGDEKKTGRWARSLHKAGLIDDVEDSWNLPDDVSITKAKIIVVGESPEGADKGADTLPAQSPVDVPPEKQAVDVPPEEQAKTKIRERFDVGDYSGCLELAESFVKDNPDDEVVLQLVDKCRKVLLQMYESRIGTFDRVPKKAVSQEEIVWRNLDPLAGFIAASVDGMMSFEDIVDISTVSRFDTCRILSQLLQDGIIE
jgi:hypothetical protein